MYEVIVSNIGTVYSGESLKEAVGTFKDYCIESENGYGKAAWESVTMTEKGEIVGEHVGDLEATREDMTAEEILDIEA